MTRKEIIKLLEMLRNCYHNWKPRDVEMTVSIWESIFRDEDPKLVFMAAGRYMNEASFFPTPADIRKIVNRMKLEESSIHEEKTAITASHEAPRCSGDNKPEYGMTDDEFIVFWIHELFEKEEEITS